MSRVCAVDLIAADSGASVDVCSKGPRALSGEDKRGRPAIFRASETFFPEVVGEVLIRADDMPLAANSLGSGAEGLFGQLENLEKLNGGWRVLRQGAKSRQQNDGRYIKGKPMYFHDFSPVRKLIDL